MTTSDPHLWTDERIVRERYARSPDRGRTIYEFRPPGQDLLGFLLGRIEWRPSGRVLDAGCGLGNYFAALAARVPGGMVWASTSPWACSGVWLSGIPPYRWSLAT